MQHRVRTVTLSFIESPYNEPTAGVRSEGVGDVAESGRTMLLLARQWQVTHRLSQAKLIVFIVLHASLRLVRELWNAEHSVQSASLNDWKKHI